jgi:hypothetical protein
VSWHLSVQKKHTKRSRKNAKPKHCTKFLWKNLYDGLHATSEIKRILFNQVVSAGLVTDNTFSLCNKLLIPADNLTNIT